MTKVEEGVSVVVPLVAVSGVRVHTAMIHIIEPKEHRAARSSETHHGNREKCVA